jgi:acyl-CoA thioesterase FadM
MAHDDGLPDPATMVLRRRIEWMDTDASGHYHWTAAFRLAEAAEAAMHSALGIAERTFGLTPRVAVSASFRRVLHFNDLVEVELAVRSVGVSSVAYRLTIATDDGVAVEGGVTTALIDRVTRQATRWPDDIRALLASGGRRPPPAD